MTLILVVNQVERTVCLIVQPVNGPECVMISRSLLSSIHQLQYRLQEAIIYQVSDDFIDITSTIKSLRHTALQSYGRPSKNHSSVT